MAGVTFDAKLNLTSSISGADGLASPRAGTQFAKSLSFTAGTATVDQADLEYAATRTLGNSTSENLDLAGVLTNPFGVVITAAEIVAIYINVTVGQAIIGAGTNPFLGPLNSTGTITLNAGDFPLFLGSRAGWPVTGATGDILKVASGAAGCTYEIVVVGRSVAH